MDGLAPNHNGFNRQSKHLTPRESQVLALVAAGKTSKEISKDLGITFKTVVCHRAHIMEKLNAHNTALLVRAAIRMGVVAD